MPVSIYGSGSITGLNNFLYSSGSTSAPAIAFTGSTSTGIYSPSQNTLGIVTNGVESLRVDNLGRVIANDATVSPVYTLIYGTGITPDFSLSNNFIVTLTGNATLSNPINLLAGQSGSIFINQDGSGGRTLAYGNYWKFAGGTAPTLSTGASAVDRLDYIVVSGTGITAIHAVLTKAYA